ncbi:YjbQ family protein [Brachybacterium phenoliresistens]|uniref:YjbQ family protein n=1 Tax=Brachybacterium phenoliresistens TaxID=396014 RepID=UPI0031D01AEA
MSTFSRTVSLHSHGGTPTFLDVTDQVRAAIADSGITTGTCTVISPHTTCAVYYDEFAHDSLADGTDFLQADLDAALSRMFPAQQDFPPAQGYLYPGEEHYREVEMWPEAATYLPGGDRRQLLNADAHLKATLIGSSEMVAVLGGEAAVGATGYLFFVDFDRSRPRERRCHIVVSGD